MQVVAVVSSSPVGQIAQILTAEELTVEYTSPTENGVSPKQSRPSVLIEATGAAGVVRKAIGKVREQPADIEAVDVAALAEAPRR